MSKSTSVPSGAEVLGEPRENKDTGNTMMQIKGTTANLIKRKGNSFGKIMF